MDDTQREDTHRDTQREEAHEGTREQARDTTASREELAAPASREGLAAPASREGLAAPTAPDYRWLGPIPYPKALEMQYRLVKERAADRIADTVLLLEHPAVITMGRRGRAEDILATPTQLQREGIDIHRVTRGGETTYHGEGQLVGYIIFDIRSRIKQIAALMHGLEQALIAFLRTEYQVAASVNPGHPGVWIGDKKIAAIGVSVQSGVTLHGFALNINPNPRHFSYIVACGTPALSHTSVARERPEITTITQLDLALIARRLQPHLSEMYRAFFQ